MFHEKYYVLHVLPLVLRLARILYLRHHHHLDRHQLYLVLLAPQQVLHLPRLVIQQILGHLEGQISGEMYMIMNQSSELWYRTQ